MTGARAPAQSTKSSVRPLGEVVEFLDSRRVPIKASERMPGPYPYYGANGLQDYVSGYIFDDKLVLLAEDGGNFDDPTRPISYLVEGKCWVNNHAHVLRATAEILPEYLNYQLAYANVTAFLSGSTRPKLTKSDAARIPIMVASLAEQSRVVDLLSRAQNIVSMRQEAEAKAKEITPALFIDTFGDPDKNENGWDLQPLESVTLAINDCPHSTPNFAEKGVICLRTTNLGVGCWRWTERRFVSECDYATRSARGYLEVGDIVISREGTLGVGAIVESGMKLCMGQRLVQIRMHPLRATPQYGLWLLLRYLHPDAVERHLAGSTSKHLNLRQLRHIKVPLPPLTLQRQFSEQVSRFLDIQRQQEHAEAMAVGVFEALLAMTFDVAGKADQKLINDGHR